MSPERDLIERERCKGAAAAMIGYAVLILRDDYKQSKESVLKAIEWAWENAKDRKANG